MVFQNQVFRQIVCYLAELFRQIVCYLAELFRQIAFPINKIDIFKEKINDIQVKIEAHEKKLDDIFEAIDKGFDFLKEKVEIFEENIDDLAVELNDDIGNLTVESEDNSLGQTFKNPFLQGSKCDFM